MGGLLQAFYPGQAGSVPYPVAAPTPVQPAIAVHHNNIPDAGVARAALTDTINVIDNSGPQPLVVGQLKVAVKHLPPTQVDNAVDVFGGLPTAPPSPSPEDVRSGATLKVMAAGGSDGIGVHRPVELPAAPDVIVEFGLPGPGGPGEEFFANYLDVLTHGTLLVFVSRDGVRTWFPSDRDDLIAVRIGEQKLVHLARILPMPFSYGGHNFRFMLSVEQHTIE